MKKLLCVLVAVMIVSVMLPFCASAAEARDALGVWAVFDTNNNRRDMCGSFLLRDDDGNEFVLALSSKIRDKYSYKFFSPYADAVVKLTVVQRHTLFDHTSIGLFRPQDTSSLHAVSVAHGSAGFTGKANLLYLDMNGVDEIDDPSSLRTNRKMVSVNVIKYDSESMRLYLDDVPEDAAAGAVLLTQDNKLIGLYYGNTNAGYCAVPVAALTQELTQLTIHDAVVTTTSKQNPPPRPDESNASTTQESKTETTTVTTTATTTTTTTTTEETTEAEGTTDDDESGNETWKYILLAIAVVFFIFLLSRILKGKKRKAVAAQTPPPAPQRMDPPPVQPYYGVTQAYYPVSEQVNGYGANQQANYGTPAVQKPICIVGQGSGYFAGKTIIQQDEIVIGRHPQHCTLCYPVQEKGISSVHCRLKRSGGQIELTDLDSSYGTFVNGVRLTPNVPTMLRIGDTFWLARSTNTFMIQS